MHMGTPMGLMGPSPWLGSLSHFESISHHALSVRIRGGRNFKHCGDGSMSLPSARRSEGPAVGPFLLEPHTHTDRPCEPDLCTEVDLISDGSKDGQRPSRSKGSSALAPF